VLQNFKNLSFDMLFVMAPVTSAVYGKISIRASEPWAESGLIHTVTLAGSQANSSRSFHIAKASGFNSNLTVLVSPGARATRWKPFSARTGCATLVPCSRT
jgi:hypothetical protein